jgi:ankyrin repeat protein
MTEQAQNRLDNEFLDAAKEGDLVRLTTAIDDGANLDAKGTGGWTALMLACEIEHTDIALALIVKGAKLDVKNDDDSTALMFASCSGHTDIALELIDKGVNLEAQDCSGSTALMLAVYGHAETVLLLLDRGANPDVQNGQGKKAMDLAHESNQESIVSAIRSWLARKEALSAISAIDDLEVGASRVAP